MLALFTIHFTPTTSLSVKIVIVRHNGNILGGKENKTENINIYDELDEIEEIVKECMEGNLPEG